VNHLTVQTLATLVLYMLTLILPFMVFLFTDRFRQQPSAGQYAILFSLAAGIGVLLFIPAISIVAATVLLALGMAWLSAKYALAGISYERELVPRRLFPGERAELTIRLRNEKILPLASLTIVDPIRPGLIRPGGSLDDVIRFSGGVEIQDNLGHALVNRTAVGPFQTVVRDYQVEVLRRGVYTLEPARLETGDLFGIFTRQAEIGPKLDIVVYPNIYKPDEIGLPLLRAVGDLAARRRAIEDPILIAGSREYQAGDALNRMHWKATARTAHLQVRQHDPSTTAQMIIVLNINTYQHLWQGIDLDRMEAAIDLAGSLAVWALDCGFAVGLRSNGVVPETERMPRIAPSASPQQSIVVLEHLARIAFSGRYLPETVLIDEARYLRGGSTIVFVTSIITTELVSILSSRALRGRVSVVYCGRFAAPVLRGVPIHLALPPARPIRAVS
jgi:uncharacterized protein (DUF58 family)